eukprot:scaffold18138_cov128-Cylindrotheca_fusiformis.AAC.7
MLSQRILPPLANSTSTARIGLCLLQKPSRTGSYLCNKHGTVRCFSSDPQQQLASEREYDSDLVVVLDLDECLIHSQFLGGRGANYAHQVLQDEHSNSSSFRESKVNTFQICLENGEEVRVHERPYVHDFLKRTSDKYETHLFTAGAEFYARPILQMLDPKGTIFSSCRFRDSCSMDPQLEEAAHVKNLDYTPNTKRTVLVDNNPLSFMANPENGILVTNFYDDPHDTTLLSVLQLLEELDEEDDVRPVLNAKFGMKRMLNGMRRNRLSANT